MKLTTGLLALLLFSVASCGGSSDALQKELSDIRGEIVKLRVQNAILTERLDSMQALSRPAPPAPAVPPAQDADRPPLDVVRLAPGPSDSTPSELAQPQTDRAASGQPNDKAHANGTDAPGSADDSSAPRPVIRMTGKPGPRAKASVYHHDPLQVRR